MSSCEFFVLFCFSIFVLPYVSKTWNWRSWKCKNTNKYICNEPNLVEKKYYLDENGSIRGKHLRKKNTTPIWLTPAKAKPEASTSGCERLWRCTQLLPERDQKGPSGEPGSSPLPGSKLLYPPYGVCEDNMETLNFHVHPETLGYPSTLWYVVSGDLGESQDRGGYGDNIGSRTLISTQQSWGTSLIWGISGGWVKNLGLNFHFVSKKVCLTFLCQKQCQKKPVKRELFHNIQSPTT